MNNKERHYQYTGKISSKICSSMKNFSVMIITLISIAAAVTGCKETITDISLDSAGPRLIVEGYISTDTMRQVVRLSRMGDALMKDPVRYVSDAVVTLSDGTTTWTLAEDPVQRGSYYTGDDVYGLPGKIYLLRISNVDIDNDNVTEEYTAQSLLKKINPVDSVHLVYNQTNPHFKGWSVNLYMKDAGEGRNFYLIKVLKNNKLLTDSIFKYSIGDNFGFEGKYFDGFPVYNLREERLDERLAAGDTVTVNVYSITEDYYSFISSFISDYWPKIPMFSGPSANIPTNILPRNRTAGIFTAYAVKRKSTVYR